MLLRKKVTIVYVPCNKMNIVGQSVQRLWKLCETAFCQVNHLMHTFHTTTIISIRPVVRIRAVQTVFFGSPSACCWYLFCWCLVC